MNFLDLSLKRLADEILFAVVVCFEWPQLLQNNLNANTAVNRIICIDIALFYTSYAWDR